MRRARVSVVGLLILLVLVCPGCNQRPDGKPEVVRLRVTGYCKCKKCTGWKRNWLFQPIYAYGPLKGKRKEVGVTADGTVGRQGVIAADTRYFPFGTVMHVPGYGYGVVHDTGSAIKGRHIDLFFTSHEDASIWGNQHLLVEVWYPERNR